MSYRRYILWTVYQGGIKSYSVKDRKHELNHVTFISKLVKCFI
jgi:hypothetical protein